MAFNLTDWLQRRKIDAQVRGSGRAVEHRRVGNPFHAVSIEPGPRCCAEARAREGRRYLSRTAGRDATGASILPIPTRTR